MATAASSRLAAAEDGHQGGDQGRHRAGHRERSPLRTRHHQVDALPCSQKHGDKFRKVIASDHQTSVVTNR